MPHVEAISAEELYEEGVSLDGDECCGLALNDEEMERMDRELDELDSDDVSCCIHATEFKADISLG